ncbi:hypothetical protein KY385_00780 [Candidatus Parcubacteria bacterium]|nr:hypothetical protein [Candidatus Parcubacteria bacterium]
MSVTEPGPEIKFDSGYGNEYRDHGQALAACTTEAARKERDLAFAHQLAESIERMGEGSRTVADCKVSVEMAGERVQMTAGQYAAYLAEISMG